MVEVFTIGGGEYIVNTFNAVAAWTGGGGYRALLRVVMVLGLIYARGSTGSSAPRSSTCA
jgi:conjugal transfer mating pair stabilization protein TraG